MKSPDMFSDQSLYHKYNTSPLNFPSIGPSQPVNQSAQGYSVLDDVRRAQPVETKGAAKTIVEPFSFAAEVGFAAWEVNLSPSRKSLTHSNNGVWSSVIEQDQMLLIPGPSQQGSETSSPMVLAGTSSSPTHDPVSSIAEIRCFDHGCCGRRFSTKGNYARHLREKAGFSKVHVCPYCGMGFTRSTARAKHMQFFRCKLAHTNILGSDSGADPGWAIF